MHHQVAHLGISLKEAVIQGCEESVHQRVGDGLGAWYWYRRRVGVIHHRLSTGGGKGT